jgi:dipeptidyl aminopeptidase/acylaminoacyl peptidase
MTRNSAVLVVPFDERTRRPLGHPVAVFDGVRVPGPGEHGTVRTSRAGDLVYAPGSDAMSARQLVVLEPDGSVRPWNETRAPITGPPAVAPDGSWAAVTQLRPSGWLYQLLRYDAGGGTVRRLAAFDNEDCGGAVISPDGRRLAYGRGGVDSTAGVWLMSVDGSAEPRRLVPGRSVGGQDQPAAWTPDGRTLLLTRNEPSGRYLRRVAVDEPGAQPAEVLRARHDLSDPRLSPDGRWLSYLSRESGFPQLHVTAWHADRPVSPGVPVSSLRAGHHWWPARGGSLLFVTTGGVLWETEVGPGPTVANPRRRASLGDWIAVDEVTSLPDGRLLLVQKGPGEGDAASLDLVLGFEREMRRALDRARDGGR